MTGDTITVDIDTVDDVGTAVLQSLRAHGLGDNECIRGSRLGWELLREHGIKSRPLAVKARIGNDRIIVGSKPGGGVVYRYTPGDLDMDTQWDGHLVLVVANQVLLDITAPQFSAPQHGLCIDAPIVLPTNGDRPVPGRRYLGCDGQPGTAGYVEAGYEVVADTYWRDTPYWNEPQHYLHLLDTARTLLHNRNESGDA